MASNFYQLSNSLGWKENFRKQNRSFWYSLYLNLTSFKIDLTSGFLTCNILINSPSLLLSANLLAIITFAEHTYHDAISTNMCGPTTDKQKVNHYFTHSTLQWSVGQCQIKWKLSNQKIAKPTIGRNFLKRLYLFYGQLPPAGIQLSTYFKRNKQLQKRKICKNVLVSIESFLKCNEVSMYRQSYCSATDASWRQTRHSFLQEKCTQTSFLH